jgi:predicted transcriptional regulator
MIAESQRRTTQIVAAYVRRNPIPTDQIGGLITSVHSTLSGLGNEIVEEPLRVPAVTVRRSVRPDYIICIDCGYKGKMLKRHLQSKHGLSVAQYRVRWKLPSDYPTTAANYSERRSQLAKSLGLGRGTTISATVLAPETTPEKPARRRSARKTIGTRTSAKKASPKKAFSRSSAKRASNRSPSRKPSFRATSKAASTP